MEKKIGKRFYLLSATVLIPIFILGGGFTKDTLALTASHLMLVLNHPLLVKLVGKLAYSMARSETDEPVSVSKLLFLLFLKMALIASAISLIYFYNQALISKLMLIMIFQLIIQVVSIKNNY